MTPNMKNNLGTHQRRLLSFLCSDLSTDHVKTLQDGDWHAKLHSFNGDALTLRTVRSLERRGFIEIHNTCQMSLTRSGLLYAWCHNIA